MRIVIYTTCKTCQHMRPCNTVRYTHNEVTAPLGNYRELCDKIYLYVTRELHLALSTEGLELNDDFRAQCLEYGQ